MENKLDIFEFCDSVKSISIGKFSEKLIDFICSKDEKYKDKLNIDSDILFWSDRVEHSKKHIRDFDNEEEFYRYLSSIPEIISKPDYISIHPSNGSISFIKRTSKNVSVAIRISATGKYAYRTMYPLRDSQLENYIKNNRAWKYE